MAVWLDGQTKISDRDYEYYKKLLLNLLADPDVGNAVHAVAGTAVAGSNGEESPAKTKNDSFLSKLLGGGSGSEKATAGDSQRHSDDPQGKVENWRAKYEELQWKYKQLAEAKEELDRFWKRRADDIQAEVASWRNKYQDCLATAENLKNGNLVKAECISSLNKKINSLQDAVDILTEQCSQSGATASAAEQKAAQLESACQALQLQYGEIDQVFRLFSELGEVDKHLARILYDVGDDGGQYVKDSPADFVARGVQEENIEALWDSIANHYDAYERAGKVADVSRIFAFFIELYKQVSSKSIAVTWPQPGDAFNERIHACTSDSKRVGKVHQVILPGFALGTGKFAITRKALVVVK